MEERNGACVDIESFYEKYKGVLIGRAKRYTKDYQMVEDIVSETMLRMISVFDRNLVGVSGERLSAYACGILSHVAGQVIMERKGTKVVSLEEELERSGENSKRYTCVTLVSYAEMVRYALDNLSGDHQAVLHFRFMESLSYEEIADLLGVSEALVRKRVSRALKMMKKILSESEYISLQRGYSKNEKEL